MTRLVFPDQGVLAKMFAFVRQRLEAVDHREQMRDSYPDFTNFSGLRKEACESGHYYALARQDEPVDLLGPNVVYHLADWALPPKRITPEEVIAFFNEVGLGLSPRKVISNRFANSALATWAAPWRRKGDWFLLSVVMIFYALRSGGLLKASSHDNIEVFFGDTFLQANAREGVFIPRYRDMLAMPPVPEALRPFLVDKSNVRSYSLHYASVALMVVQKDRELLKALIGVFANEIRNRRLTDNEVGALLGLWEPPTDLAKEMLKVSLPDGGISPAPYVSAWHSWSSIYEEMLDITASAPCSSEQAVAFRDKTRTILCPILPLQQVDRILGRRTVKGEQSECESYTSRNVQDVYILLSELLSSTMIRKGLMDFIPET